MAQDLVGRLFSVAGKVTLITGGSSGLGLMMAEAYLRAGARVYITGRKPDQLASRPRRTVRTRRRARHPGGRGHARRASKPSSRRCATRLVWMS